MSKHLSKAPVAGVGLQELFNASAPLSPLAVDPNSQAPTIPDEAQAAQFTALLQAAPAGIIYADATGRLVLVNAANARIWGDHPLSTSVDEYIEWRGWWADGSARHGQRVAPRDWALSRALRGEDVSGDIVEIEPFGRPGERKTIQLQATPVRAADGSILGGVVVQMDITEQVRAQSALRASEARFRALVDNIPQLAWMADASGRMDWFNDRWQAFTGQDPALLDGAVWQSLVHPDHVERVIEAFTHQIALEMRWEDTFPMRGRSGDYCWFLSRAVPIRGADGGIRWFGTSTDVTRQRHAEDALRETDRRKDEFLAMLAHELRNPLAPISAAAHVLGVTAADDPQRVRSATAIIMRQVEHMTELVDDLLDVSRVTRGIVELDIETLDLKALLATAIEQAGPLIEARHHSLSTRLGPGRFWVRGDRTRLVQVLSNLLNNAAKYTPPGGEITVQARVCRDIREVQLDIRDNGPGLDPLLIPHIFELFTQAARTPDRAQGGLGIGLALVRSIVQQHGGHVRASSPDNARGSTFTVTLPLAESPEQTADPPLAPSPAQPALRRVAVVDDNLDAAQTLATLLQLSGFEACAMADGASALSAAEQSPAHVYILDIGMPVMDGYELARRLRAQPATADATLVALTGYGQDSDRRAAAEAGFDRHFVKPANLNTLLAYIANALHAAAS